MKSDVILLLSFVAAAALTVLTAGCGDDDEASVQEGSLTLELWGEAFIEEGIPEEEFGDGFAVHFDTFLINLGGITVAEADTVPVITMPKMTVWDLTRPGPLSLSSENVSAGDYTHTAYVISPATGKSVGGNVEDDVLTLMTENGYSIYVAGSATDGVAEVSFAWGFDTDTTYDPCHSTGALEPDSSTAVQITIHGDHLFYDSAVSEDPQLRFGDIAEADADSDGEVTREELEAIDILPLDYYNVGSLDIDNLWDYLAHMTTTVGHIDGEGHCD
jgi:hypothetical protein